jgi:hypothetical protein
MVGTDLKKRVNAGMCRIIQELIEHVLGVQGSLLALCLQYQDN